MFVSKFNPTGTALVYSTFLGSTGNTEGWGIAVDPGGNAYVVGDTDTRRLPRHRRRLPDHLRRQLHRSTGITRPCAQRLRRSRPRRQRRRAHQAEPHRHRAGVFHLPQRQQLQQRRAVAVDAAGEAYVAGLTNSQCNLGVYSHRHGYQPFDCYPTTAGAAQAGVNVSTGGGTRNFTFFSKLDAAGANLLYSTLLGPNNFQQQSTTAPLAIAIDPAGLAYVSGYSSNNLFTTAGSYQPTVAALPTISTALSPNSIPPPRRLIYSTYVSGPKGSMPYVAADAAGNAYLAGNTTDCSLPHHRRAPTRRRHASRQAPPRTATPGFVTKLEPHRHRTALVHLHRRRPSQWRADRHLDAIALGSDGSVYVAGKASGSRLPHREPRAPQSQTYQYKCQSRLNPTGTALLFSTTLSGTAASADNATGIAVDSSREHLRRAAYTNSYTLPVTAGVFQSTNTMATPARNVTGFVAKIAPTVTTTTTLTLPSGTVTAGQPATSPPRSQAPPGQRPYRQGPSLSSAAPRRWAQERWMQPAPPPTPRRRSTRPPIRSRQAIRGALLSRPASRRRKRWSSALRLLPSPSPHRRPLHLAPL